MNKIWKKHNEQSTISLKTCLNLEIFFGEFSKLAVKIGQNHNPDKIASYTVCSFETSVWEKQPDHNVSF